MRILVTGRNGQVGHELSLLAENSTHQWLCLDRQGLDVTSQDDVDRVIDNFKPDVVINATAYTAVDKAETEREIATIVNANGPRYLAIACERNGAALLHISTDYVFSGDAKAPYSEDDPVGPTGHYGASKLAGESAVAEYCSRHIILRTAWVFGTHGNNFVKTMLRIGAERDELGVVNDQLGAPTSAKGIAASCIAIANIISVKSNEDIPWGIYHYTGAPYTSWFGFAEHIFASAVRIGLLAKAPKLKPISSDQFPTPAKRPANSRLSCAKLTRFFGINPDDWSKQLNNVLIELSNKNK
jgi:dTDP-4-dehydrorhamnose reductase